MKKKKNVPAEITEDGEIFPVDTLGIPILVDVVETGTAASDTGNNFEITAEVCETEHEPLKAQPDSDREYLTELHTDPQLDLATDNIVKSVTAEITRLLEPMVRARVSLALQKYQDELLKTANKERK